MPYRVPMPTELLDTDVVVRFSPFSSEGMARNIRKDHTIDVANAHVPARYRLSVFVTSPQPGEGIVEAADRLCLEMVSIAGAPNGDRISVVEGRILNDAGFRTHVDEPPLGHYVVGKSDHTEMPDTDALAEIFSQRRKNVAFKG